MAAFQTFERDLRVATAGLEPAAIAAQLARFAKVELAAAIQRGDASPTYERFVNGRAGAPEESVVPPGPILYVFAQWGEIIRSALAYLEKRSPRLKGDYLAAHTVMVKNAPVPDPSRIPAAAKVLIVNTVPYARKIEVGAQRLSVPRGVYEDLEQELIGQFGRAGGLVYVRKRMVQLPNGYVLKGRFRMGFRSKARRGLARDTNAGARMTYPAIELSMQAYH